MTSHLLLVLVAVTAVALHHACVVVARGWRHPAVAMGLVQGVFLLGTLAQVDLGQPVQWRYALVVTTATLVLLGASVLLALAGPRDRPLAHGLRPGAWWAPKPTWQLWAVFSVSVVVVAVYYAAVGYIPVVESVRDLAGTADSDLAGLRLASYGGDQYLAPGYVNQFRNVLLPVSTTLLAIGLVLQRSRWRWLFIGVAGPFAAAALLGTGQRTAFLLGAGVSGAIIWASPVRLSRPARLGLVGAGVALLVAATYALGRGDGASLGATLGQLAQRLLFVNQEAGIVAFEYLDGRPVQYGSEWLESLAGLLPGQADSSLASEIFAHRYGLARGTSPPSMWASVAYNFGWLGVVGVPVLLAWSIHALHARMQAPSDRNLVEFAGLGGMAILLVVWVTNGPTFLFNNGLPAYLAILTLGVYLRRVGLRRARPASDLAGAAPRGGSALHVPTTT